MLHLNIQPRFGYEFSFVNFFHAKEENTPLLQIFQRIAKLLPFLFLLSVLLFSLKDIYILKLY